MIPLQAHPEGVTLPVRAQPGARKSAIVGVQGDALKIAVSAPPVDGKANEALIEVLREALGVKRWQVELLSGASNRNKVFLIRGVALEELQARVQACLESTK